MEQAMTSEQQAAFEKRAALDQKSEECRKTNKRRIFAALRKLGIDEVVISYSGEGDEGNIEDPEFYPDDIDISKKKVLMQQPAGGVYTDLETAIYEFTEALLDDNYGSWGDGEGSTGTVTWQVEAGEIHVEHGYPTVEYGEATY